MFPEEQAWIVNPKRTRRKKGKRVMARVKHRSHRKRSHHKRRRRYVPGSRRTKKAMAGYTLFGSNPRRRKRRSYSHNPRRRHRRHYRHNPDGMTGFLWDAVYVTGGFVGNRVVSNMVLPMIPGVSTMPILRIVGKGAVAWALGWASGMMLGRRAGNLVMVGGLVDALDDAVKTYVAPFIPALAGDDMAAYPMLPMSAYPSLGNYTSPYANIGDGEYSSEDSV